MQFITFVIIVLIKSHCIYKTWLSHKLNVFYCINNITYYFRCQWTRCSFSFSSTSSNWTVFPYELRWLEKSGPAIVLALHHHQTESLRPALKTRSSLMHRPINWTNEFPSETRDSDVLIYFGFFFSRTGMTRLTCRLFWIIWLRFWSFLWSQDICQSQDRALETVRCLLQ